MNFVETRTAKIGLDENNILHFLLNENISVDYEDALDNYLVVKNFTKGEPCLKLIDIRHQVKISSKAKRFIDSKDVQAKTIARAILVSNTVAKLTLNFFIKFNSMNVPTKFFVTEQNAIDWLKTF